MGVFRKRDSGEIIPVIKMVSEELGITKPEELLGQVVEVVLREFGTSSVTRVWSKVVAIETPQADPRLEDDWLLFTLESGLQLIFTIGFLSAPMIRIHRKPKTFLGHLLQKKNNQEVLEFRILGKDIQGP